MKNPFCTLVFALIFFQCCVCKKDEVIPKKEVTVCSEVNSSDVPRPVTESFQKQFSEQTVSNWFRKDEKGYVALVSYEDEKIFLHFTNEGEFVKKQNTKHYKEKHKCESECHKDKEKDKHTDIYEKDEKGNGYEKDKWDKGNECYNKDKSSEFEKTWDEGCVCKLIEIPKTTGVSVP